MPITLGDNVRVLDTPLTKTLGLAGLVGQVYGETTPSSTGVEVVGQASEDHAIAVQLEGKSDSIWLAPDLLELIDHGPGTEIVIGNVRLIRNASGEWIKPAARPWWRFWK